MIEYRGHRSVTSDAQTEARMDWEVSIHGFHSGDACSLAQSDCDVCDNKITFIK